MKRRQVEQTTDLCFDFRRDEGGTFKRFAAVNDTVTDGLNLINRCENAMLLVCQFLKHFANRSSMFKDFADFRYILFTGWFMRQDRGIHTDPLNQSFSQNRFVGHIIKLVFQGGASRIND
ncbi:hypothetical protein D3C73_1396700 [compost metagenome]